MTLRPVGATLILKPVASGDRVILTAEERPQQGEVIAGNAGIEVKVGDRVLIAKYSAMPAAGWPLKRATKL